ncbi:MAG TPA: hypothetical protein VF135_03385 [Terriglobales bacterium]
MAVIWQKLSAFDRFLLCSVLVVAVVLAILRFGTFAVLWILHHA